MKIKTASLLLILVLSIFGGIIVAVSGYSLSNSYEIESSWSDFEELHSEKGRALNDLRREIGYGGLIHHFKNYILRQNPENADAVKFSLGGAKSSIAAYRSLTLNAEEEVALNHIEQIVSAYSDALPVIVSLIISNENSKEIDRLVKVDDTAAINGLSILLEQGQNQKAKKNKLSVLSEIRHAMGFGGMIHNFKNAVLRGDASILTLAQKDLIRAQQLTDNYAEFSLNPKELGAVRKIQDTLLLYAKKINKIKEMGLINSTPESIDRVVQVNDKPAFDGFATLSKEVVLNANKAEENLSLSLVKVIGAEKAVIYLTLLTIVILLCGSYLLIKLQIIKPISRLTDSMSSIANKKFDVEIYGVDKIDEIGEMARAIKSFKENQILLEERELALSLANHDLESIVLDRTRELKNSENSMRAILETAVDAIVTIDTHGTVISFNRAAEDMFGFTCNEVIGKNVNMLMPDMIKEKHDEYMQSYIESGKSNIVGTLREMTACRKGGGVFPIHLSISEINSSDGLLFTGIVRDISDLKVYQKSLLASEEVAINANKAKSEFIASMNHELRTPLNAILGFAQLLECDKNQPLTPVQQDLVEEINKAGQHLIGIINQILDFNKIEAGKTSISIEQASPSELVQESLALIIQMTDAQNIELINNIDYDKLPDLLTDKMRFKQILINLLSNAVKYNSVGGKIFLDTKLENKKLRFTVKDTGKGIPLYRQPQIFVPFERMGHEDGNIEGTGIGLSITKKLVELMHGNIGFESDQGVGSCFWFELPACDAAVKEEVRNKK